MFGPETGIAGGFAVLLALLVALILHFCLAAAAQLDAAVRRRESERPQPPSMPELRHRALVSAPRSSAPAACTRSNSEPGSAAGARPSTTPWPFQKLAFPNESGNAPGDRSDDDPGTLPRFRSAEVGRDPNM